MTPNTTSASDNKHLLWCILAVCQKDFEEQDTKLSLAFLDDGGAFIGKRWPVFRIILNVVFNVFDHVDRLALAALGESEGKTKTALLSQYL